MTTTAQLTPQSDQSPVVVNISKELSGPQWAERFPGSTDPSALADGFRTSVEKFIAAMESAGIDVRKSSTYRPPKRSYLMHWCWKIKHGTDPSTVPPRAGVNIEWVHPTLEQSRQAAREMVTAFAMDHLTTAPALQSRHNDRKAIDMTITWQGDVDVIDGVGNSVQLNTAPRTGMNLQLKEIGRSYGVIKYIGGAADKPHWSTDGH